MSSSEPILRLSGVSKQFGTHAALRNVDLEVGAGEIVGIIGRSGAGKSTLIRCINGLERPDSGRVEIEGRSIERLSESELKPVRRRVGMVFQHFNLLANRTAAENIALPLKIAGVTKADRGKRVLELLNLVGLDGRQDRYPAQLSGGQKQRVGIARALAADPAMLLSDEATSALDPETTEQILGLLADINQRLGLTILLITHEMDVVRRIASRVLVLDGGAVAEQGPTWRVFADPQADATRNLLKSVMQDLPASLVLSPEGPGEAILRVEVGGDSAGEPLLSDLALRFNAAVRIVAGEVRDIHGVAAGRLFLGIDLGKPEDLSDAIAYLSARTIKTELVGYVVRPV